MEEKYELTVEVLGPDEGQSTEVRVLNRILRWAQHGIEYEADPRHVEIILKQLNIGECKAVTTPGTREEGQAKAGDEAARSVEEKLNDEKHSVYRAVVARANYLSPDRPDIGYSVKELASAMSSPCRGDWDRLKRLARYLKGRPGVVHKFAWQKPTPSLSIYSDVDTE